MNATFSEVQHKKASFFCETQHNIFFCYFHVAEVQFLKNTNTDTKLSVDPLPLYHAARPPEPTQCCYLITVFRTTSSMSV